MIRPWIHDFSAQDHFDQPLGLLSIAAALRTAGVEVNYLDCLESLERGMDAASKSTPAATKLWREYPSAVIEKPSVFRAIPRYFKRFGISPEEFQQKLDQFPSPNAILIASAMTYWYPGVQAAIAAVRRFYPEAPIAVGGVYATLCHEHARTHLDGAWIFPGRAGEPLAKWLNAVIGLKMAPDIFQTTIAPAWDLVRNLRYLVLRTSSGCPRLCSYCAAGLLHSHYRAEPLETLERAVEEATERYGVSHIALYDDELAYDHDRFREFLRLLRQRDFPVTWHLPNAMAARAVAGEVAELMKACGFEQPRLSLDGFDRRLGPQGLDADSLTLIKQAGNALQSAGFRSGQTSVYVLAGLPGQELLWLEKACVQLLDAGFKPYMSQFSPIPGTPLGDQRLLELGCLDSKELLLTNKVFSVYGHSRWTGEEFNRFTSTIRSLREKLCA